MLSVKSSDLQKSFGKYLEKSLQEPIAVMKYDRPTAYLVSAAQYEALMESHQRAISAGQLTEREIGLIRESRVSTDQPFRLDDLDEEGRPEPARSAGR